MDEDGDQGRLDGIAEPVTWSVAQVNEWVSVTLAEAFPGDIWVEGEVCNLNRSRAGHVYFTLIEPGEDPRHPDHGLSITLFDSYRQKVNLALRRAGGAVRMDDGVRVRIRGRIELYGARGQVQLRMVAIDPTFTLGDLAAQRERVRRALAAEGLLEAQSVLPLPALPMRIGLVTSLHSAAHADFLGEITNSGLGFEVVVVDARVQGVGAESGVVAALLTLDEHDVDVIAVVRGGGARTDLSTFDSEIIARCIAGRSRPVWTGIGHEVDRTIADEVAHRVHKTPTACAAAIVDQVRATARTLDAAWADVVRRAGTGADRHAGDLDRRAGRVATAARSRADRAAVRLAGDIRHLRSATTTRLTRDEARLDAGRRRIDALVPRTLERARRRVTVVEDRLRAYDPRRTLARGWSLTRRVDGTLVRGPGDVGPGEALVTTTSGGTIHSTTTAGSDPGPTPDPEGGPA